MDHESAKLVEQMGEEFKQMTERRVQELSEKTAEFSKIPRTQEEMLSFMAENREATKREWNSIRDKYYAIEKTRHLKSKMSRS
jgi:hypothetical protein